MSCYLLNIVIVSHMQMRSEAFAKGRMRDRQGRCMHLPISLLIDCQSILMLHFSLTKINY